MYKFDMDRLQNRCYNRFSSNMYIPGSHTNRRFIKNTIGVAMNHLVSMGLKLHNYHGLHKIVIIWKITMHHHVRDLIVFVLN